MFSACCRMNCKNRFFQENAHFLLSEMLIGAIEQMKWRNVLSTQWPSHPPSESSGHAKTIRHPTAMEEEFASASYEGVSDGSGEHFLTSSSDLSWSRELQSSNSFESSLGADLRSDINATFGEGQAQQAAAGPSTETGYGTGGQRR